MRISALLWMALAAVASAAPATSPATAPATTPTTAPWGSDAFFSQRRLWEFHIHLSAEAWKRMQPEQRNRFLPRRTIELTTRPATLPATRPEDDDPVISPVGNVFKPATGRLHTPDGRSAEISIRFKGNYSYTLAAKSPRRPMKIEFDRIDPSARFLGLRTLNLNTGALDHSMMRESLGYAVFRAAKVPASRTAFARVTLTVDGLYNRQDLGIYAIVEQMDEEMLLRHFGSDQGTLLKPEMLRGIPYFGGRWEQYTERYNNKSELAEPSKRKFIEFQRLIHFADDAAFAAKLEQYLDVDDFLRFIAVQALIVNLDSFLTTGHNYYLYEDPRDGRYRFIPWDLNLSWGLFGMAASERQQADLSLRRPHVPPNRLIERVVSNEGFAKRQDKILEQLAREVFTKPRLAAMVAELKRDMGGNADIADLERFLARRLESVEAQMSGKRPGFIPSQSPSLSLRSHWADVHRASLVDSAARGLRDSGLLGKSGDVAEILAGAQKRFGALLGDSGPACTPEQLAEVLADNLPLAENFVFDPGPGIDWARIIFATADGNKDGRLSRDELATALREALKAADASGDGRLDGREIDRALNARAQAVK